VRRSGSAKLRRAAMLAALAALCALLAAGAAARHDAGLAGELGELREVLVVEEGLARGTSLRGRVLDSALGRREVPARFLPPDTIADPAGALGGRLAADVPAGSYLLGSHLRSSRPERAGQRVAPGLRPVDVVVGGAAGAVPARGSRVDVLAADEPGSTTNPRLRVLARRVELLAIEPVRGRTRDATDEGGWLATLALDRRTALAVIEADNYARELRLLER
jgi:Flp pilus assembly protein CpaB